MKKHLLIFVLIGVFASALIIRLYGLTSNQPFWVDEFSSGTQARLIQKYGYQLLIDSDLRSRVEFEHQNIPYHILIASSFSVFGENEWVARLPSALIGALIPLLLFYLMHIFGYTRSGIFSAILTVHVHFQALWSVQARGYMLLQTCILSALIIYTLLASNNSNRALKLISLVAICIIGLLSHITFMFLILALLIHYVLSRPFSRKSFLVMGTILLAIVLSLYASGSITKILFFFTQTYTPVDNAWYYHSFLWRQYQLVTFLGVLGIVGMVKDSPKKMYPIIIFSGLYMIFILYIFGHHMTKYLLPIFPFLLAGMGYMIHYISGMLSRSVLVKFFIGIVITYSIILNGNTFISKPRKYISLNTHFREISTIDYNLVYERVQSKMSSDTAIVETWPGRSLWYLGNDFQHTYLYRWENEDGFMNGHEMKTSFYTKDGIKRVSDSIGFVSTQSDLAKLMKRHPTGFIFIDDSSLPASVREYADSHLTKELYLDHYPLDDNPYSIWPATLYSWGFTSNK